MTERLRIRVRRTALSWFAFAIVVLIATAAGAGWWYFLRSTDAPLEANWSARVHAIAGDGVAGFRDGDAARARFADPFGIAAAPDGTIFIADAGEAPRIRRLSPDGRVDTLAGGAAGFADGIGSAARFSSPSGLALAPDGTLYVADTANNAIRRITRDGQVSTVAGDGVSGYRDGAGAQARFNGPIGVAVDASGRVLVADAYNDRIRAVLPGGSVITIAGGAEAGAIDGAAGDARFDTPCGVAVDALGRIFVADTGNGLVREISPQGLVTTATHAGGVLSRPIAIAVSPDGTRYITDERGWIAELSASGTRSVAGSTPGFGDGAGADARFRRPAGIAVQRPGRLIVADAGNALVRLVVAASQVELRPPASPLIAPQFDLDAFEVQALLWPIEPMDGPFEIAGTIGEARGEDGERFHAGIDVRADDGTPVVAVRAGLVTSPLSTDGFGSLSESIRIGPISYVHLRVGRDRRGDPFDAARFVPSFDEKGRMTRMRVKRGARFATGDAIGTINPFNHVHLNVGWPGEEHNPLHFRLPQFTDTIVPTIAPGGVRLYDEQAAPLAKREKGRLLISGRVQIVVNAWDQADGNRPQRRLGLYALGYQVLERDGSPAPGFEAPRETIRFDRLVSDPEVARLVYAPGSGIPFYGRRTTRFLYIVTNSFRDGVATPGLWDTSELAPGDYTLRIIASDIRGNVAVANRDVPVTIVGAGPEP